MEVQHAKLRDAGKLAEISKLANKEFNFWTYESREKFSKIIKDKCRGVYFVKDNGLIIAYLSYKCDEDERRLWIEQVYIIKKFRRRDIAKTLIKMTIKKFRKIKHLNIVLLTADRNINIFEKLGFKKTMNFMEYNK